MVRYSCEVSTKLVHKSFPALSAHTANGLRCCSPPGIALMIKTAGLIPSRTEGIYLLPLATQLMIKAAGPRPSRTQGACLLPSSIKINEIKNH